MPEVPDRNLCTLAARLGRVRFKAVGLVAMGAGRLLVFARGSMNIIYISILSCVCTPCNHRDPFGLFAGLFFQQGAHGHLDGMGQRRPIQAVVKTYLLGAPGRIVRRSWWPFIPFNSADVHGPPSSCGSELVDLALSSQYAYP